MILLLDECGKKSHKVVRGILIFLALAGFISFADAFETYKLQWGQGVSAKLQRDEVFTYMGYSVKAIAFPPPIESNKYSPTPQEPVNPFVGLNVSENGIFITTIALALGESYILPDGELKITAKQLPSSNSTEWLFESYSPWALVELNPRGIPNLEVSIDTGGQTEYASASFTDIVANVTLKNTGTADAFNIDMIIETELPIKTGNLKYHYDTVGKGSSTTETLTFSSPIITEQKMYTILANVTGYDIKYLFYTAEVLKTISVVITPEQTISLRKSVDSKMYLKDYTIVSLSVKNNGKYDLKNVSITDFLPNSFKLLGNNSLHWIVDIPAYGEWDNRYLVKPEEPNREGILFPAASAEFMINNELYRIRSNQPKVVVYGAKVVLMKQTDVTEINQGDTVTVTVVAENTGSTPTRIAIKDEVPNGTTVLKGSTSHEDFLEANKKTSFSYTIRVDSRPPIKLPPASADYFELGNKGGKISTISQAPEIRNKASMETRSSVPTPNIIKPKPTPTISATPVPTPPKIESKRNSTNSSGFSLPGKPTNKFSIYLDFILVIIAIIVFMLGALFVTNYRQKKIFSANDYK